MENSQTLFIGRVPDGQEEEVPSKLRWTSTTISSFGWSGTCRTESGTQTLFVKVVEPSTSGCNELHVCYEHENWRKHQLCGFLDNGTLYSSYGSFVQGDLSRWKEKGDVCGVVITKNHQLSLLIAKFYVNGVEQCQFLFPKNKTQKKKIILSTRVHPNGKLISVVEKKQ
mmetsp:Transcript_32339/g.44424  ORF Transcript_32339/g.44424 Transcript_32339/m.44424 type:complete len:169 (+) Transcript_32339:49-555(+)